MNKQCNLGRTFFVVLYPTRHTSRVNTPSQHDKQLRSDSHTRLNGDAAFYGESYAPQSEANAINTP
ncbi:hypothetical protein E2C01_024470 [Portunus trituberculatus]|uniref:Uncharacterized protein n=1 Tax=Portunus trituberculatus TaxID=210409 RepID=A0A5B7ECE7_PORTR|nr:hypothetical protein [Portunus trituberculatus]